MSSGTVVLIDYGSGNLHSAGKALERAARESGSGQPILVTSDPEAVRAAERVVLPGVGAYADCRRGLDAVPGMVDALTEVVRDRGRPFLGICVGLQLMASRGLEHGVTHGLDWIPGDVVKLAPDDASLKIPHMGWNSLEARRPHKLLDGISTGEAGLDAYFVHSYHLAAADEADIVAVSEYGQPVTAMVARDNLAGTQFHPEKSQTLGLALLANFLRWTP
ncbi:MAG: imidazole glycerol phosphate synthase, glutamine amidotransferase subunit [Xanthobacteraceae bacterium]|jgi:glutamine amidotransferase|nr:imidazole glycerol phosphate synthase, glutamine amidotransferase subunit [Xanthobacteraceae bacterium]